MQQGGRHPHRSLDQGADRRPQIRRPLPAPRSRPLARGGQPRIRGRPQPAEELAPERLQRRHPHPHRALENQGRADGRSDRLHVAFSAQGRDTQKTVGGLPRRFDFGPVGLHRTRAVRLRRRPCNRLLRRHVLHRHGESGRPFPRMDDRRRRPLPAPPCPLCGHALHHPRHGHGTLHRRQRTAALQRPDEIQRRRTGPPVQRDGQALHREDGRHLPRCVPHRQRHHGQRMQIPAQPRARLRDPQRFRERFRVDGRRIRRQARRSPQDDDRSGRSLLRHEVLDRPADRGNQRPLRIPQQGARCLPRFAQDAGRIREPRPRNTGLHHGAGSQPRPAARPPGPSGRRIAAHRRQPLQIFDPCARIPRQRPHRPRAQRLGADDRQLEGQGALRADLLEPQRRHLRQGLLRTARRHGHDGVPVVLRTVGLYAARIGGLLGADRHHHAGGLRSVGQQTARTRRCRSRSPRRLQRPRRGGRHCRRAAAFQQTRRNAGRENPPLGL